MRSRGRLGRLGVALRERLRLRLREGEDMARLLAVLAFALAVIFYAWSLAHGIWTWQFFMLWGFLLECLSGERDLRFWKRS